MKKINAIKIDQIRFYIPYDRVDQAQINNYMLPNEVAMVNGIFGLVETFKDSGNNSSGRNGYTNGYVFGDDQSGCVSIYWNPHREDMGITIDFTATGKIQYEKLNQLHGKTVDWLDLIRDVVNTYEGHISRIDVACDLINYGYSVNKIVTKIYAGQYGFLNAGLQHIPRNRFQTVGSLDEYQTLYVGSRRSDGFLRIYDKKVEQSRANAVYVSLALECQDWIRVEAEFKHRLAHAIGNAICNINDHDEFYCSLVDLIVSRWQLIDESSKREDPELTKEWHSIDELRNNNRLKLNLKPNDAPNFYRKIMWFLERGPAGLLFQIEAVLGSDNLDKLIDFVRYYIDDNDQEGHHHITPNEKAIIKNLQLETTGLDFDNFIEQMKKDLKERDKNV